MGAYILRRLLLIVPTLIGILLINFLILQFLPGGPIESMLAKAENIQGGGLERLQGGAGDGLANTGGDAQYRGARGLDPKYIAQLEEQFGLDKPPVERFFIMLANYFTFDFGKPFFQNGTVVDLILDKLPVSLTLGAWTFLLSYSISIPLGVRKAVKDGTPFDSWTSAVIIIGYAIPAFLFAVLLLVFFAGGSFLQIFPNRGLHSSNWEEMSYAEYVLDYLWHIILPVSAMAIGGFASLTLLTKNSFLDEIKKQYVTTARAKGLTERRVLYGHVFRNAMLIVIAGFPAVFIGVFFSGSLIIETIFSLDGLGRLGAEAAVARDYPVIFGTLFIFGLMSLFVGILSDLMYVFVDPRIDFERREG